MKTVQIFFNFGTKLILTTFQASPIDLQIEDQKLIKGNYDEIVFPVVFKQSDGDKLTDILDTGFPKLYLISDRMVTILKKNALTGWKTYPVIVFDKKDNEVPGYLGLSITGRSGPITYDESSIFERRYVPTGPICKFYKGEFIDEWDGSDFFVPEKTCGIFITKKTADLLKINKITNLRLENIADRQVNINHLIKK